MSKRQLVASLAILKSGGNCTGRGLWKDKNWLQEAKEENFAKISHSLSIHFLSIHFFIHLICGLDSGLLLLEVQVAAVARGAYYQLRSFLATRDLAMVTHTLVASRSDYHHNALFVGQPLKTIATFQLVQNAADCMLLLCLGFKR